MAGEPGSTKSMETGLGNSGQSLRLVWPAFDGLTQMGKDGSVLPGLAKEWKNVDNTTWEFTLGDYKFHNGRDVTVEDVVETYARYRNPDNQLNVSVAFATVDKVEAVNNKTIRITTKVPDPTLPNILSLPMILPMRELEQAGAVEFFRQPIGTGPYRVLQADYSSAIKWEAMGSGFASPRGTANVQELEFRFVSEPAARAAALQSGEVDISWPLTEDQIPSFEQAGFKVVRQNATSTVHFLLDPLSGPTQDVRVRKAINYAVDKESIVQALFRGNARIDSQIIGPTCLGFNPDLKPYPFDRALARQLLAEAGYPNGFSAPMSAITSEQAGKEVAEVVAAQLKEVGIETEITVKETAIWITELYGTPDKRQGFWPQILNWDQTYEPNSVWRWFSSDIPVERGRRWNDETFDQLYQKAKSTFDREERAKLYMEAGRYLFEQAPVLYLWQTRRPGAMKAEISWDADLNADSFVASLRRG